MRFILYESARKVLRSLVVLGLESVMALLRTVIAVGAKIWNEKMLIPVADDRVNLGAGGVVLVKLPRPMAQEQRLRHGWAGQLSTAMIVKLS